MQASERGFVVYVVADGKAQRATRQDSACGPGTGWSRSSRASPPARRSSSEGSDRLADGMAVEAVGRPDASPPAGGA